VQKYIEGHDLSQEIVTGTQLSEVYIIKLLHDILEVLTVVHQQNLIHRDLKPSNIRRRKCDDKIVLIDFGAIKEVTTQIVNPQGQISFTSFIHTAGYAPSEQLKGQASYSSDIYAVGVICIYALTGIDPSSNGLPINCQTGEIVWRDRTKVNVSSKLANIIDKMVRYDYRERYQSAEKALQAIKELSPKPQSRPWKVWLGAGVVVAIAPLILLLFYQVIHPKSKIIPYENLNDGIKTQHPDNWKLVEFDGGFEGKEIQFLPKNQQQVGSCPLEIKININELPAIISLDEYKNNVLQKINNSNSNPQIIDKSETSTKLSNFNAYQLVSFRREGQCNLQVMEIGTVRNGHAYYVTYTTEEKEYPKYLSVAEEIINSLEITQKN